LTKVLTVCAPGTVLPKKLPTPLALQVFIRSLKRKSWHGNTEKKLSRTRN